MLVQALWGSFTSRWALWLGLVLHLPGVNATGATPVKGMMMQRAAELGLGRGEISGYFANLRALTEWAGPEGADADEEGVADVVLADDDAAHDAPPVSDCAVSRRTLHPTALDGAATF